MPGKLNSQIPKITYFLLFLIVAGGFFLRFHNSYNNLRFLNDESAIMSNLQQIDRALSNRDLSNLPLKGPHAETFIPQPNPSFHHGAFFFYVTYLPALVSHFHPYGPSFFVILLNTLSIYLIYQVGKDLLGSGTGLISALLLATSSFAITYSRWIWNPNLIIFFVLLSLLSALKIFKGNLKYWPLFAFAAATTTQMHILGYVFIFIIFGPLLFVLRWPKGKLLILTIFIFFLPLLPEIFSELSSGFQFSQEVMEVVGHYLGEYSAPFDIMKLFKIPLTSFLALKDEGIPLLPLIIAPSIIILFFAKTKSLRLSGILNKNTYIFILGVISTVGVIFFAKKHLEMGPTHPLLFGLPVFLLILSFLIRQILSSRFTFVFGVLAIAIYLQSNLSGISEIWYGKIPNFEDQLHLAKYLENNPDISDIFIEEEKVMGSIPWVVLNYTSLGGEIFTTEDFHPRYIIVNSAFSHWGDTLCSNHLSEKYFNSLGLYQCR